jgi:hypothetical protein
MYIYIYIYIFTYMCVCVCVYSSHLSVDVHCNCFHFFGIVNSVAVNTGVQLSDILISSVLDISPVVEFLDQMVVLLLIFFPFLLFIYSQVHTLFGSFLPSYTLPPPSPSPSLPSRTCYVIFSSSIEE